MAARMTDLHLCPAFTVVVPHLGGPILPPCSPNVTIESLAAARVTDQATCVFGPPDIIVKGSTSVFINSLAAARQFDQTAHGGVIAVGCPTVFIGG
jgi:uncharacterized Zn-binding protein involved in type VI secretion